MAKKRRIILAFSEAQLQVCGARDKGRNLSRKIRSVVIVADSRPRIRVPGKSLNCPNITMRRFKRSSHGSMSQAMRPHVRQARTGRETTDQIIDGPR